MPATCAISGHVYNADGTGAVGVLVRARIAVTAPTTAGDGLASGVAGSVYTDAAGAWTVTLMQGLTAWIEIPAAGVDHLFTVPAAATAGLADVTLYREFL